MSVFAWMHGASRHYASLNCILEMVALLASGKKIAALNSAGRIPTRLPPRDVFVKGVQAHLIYSH
jgi:hypothetical protein